MEKAILSKAFRGAAALALMLMATAPLSACTVFSASGESVAEGGTLVYSTCTVFDNENGQQIRRFLADNDCFAPVTIDLPQFPEADGQSTHQFLPCNGMQGFFVAVLKKVK